MKHFLFTTFLILSINMFSQNMVFDTVFSYLEAYSEPDSNWNSLSYNDSLWKDTLINNIGFGHDDDSIVINKCNSLYIRGKFTVADKSAIKEVMLMPEFDDGFVAYINGKEICRRNLGKKGTFVPYNQLADRSNNIYRYRPSYNQIQGMYLDSILLKSVLQDGDNILAVQVHNDSIDGSDLGFRASIINISGQPYDVHELFWEGYKQVELDSSHLPIVCLELPADAFESDTKKYNATMKIISNPIGINKLDDTTYDYLGNIGIEIKGQSSSHWPKRNFRVETRDLAGENLNVEILGMPKDNDWILYGPFADRSLIRNALAFTLGQKLPDYSPRGKFVELVQNDEYMGIYYLMETIKRDRNRVDVKKLTETSTDITGGYIMKWDKDYYYDYPEIIYPKPEDITQEQKQYVIDFYYGYKATLKDSATLLDSVNGYKKYIARPSFIDFTIINEIAKNPDAYRYSTYMHKDIDDNGKKLHYGPIWDFDLAFGNSTFQGGDKTYGWQFNEGGGYSNNRLAHRTLFQDTMLVREFHGRWHELRNQPLHIDSVLAYMDSLTDYLGNRAFANYQVWPMEGKHMGLWGFSFSYSYAQELQNLKSWITQRYAWLDDNVDKLYFPYKRPKPIVPPTSLVSNKYDISVYPNPVVDYITVGGYKCNTGKIVVTDIIGNELVVCKLNSSVSDFENQLDLSDLESGMYILKIYENESIVYTGQIVKK